MQRHRWGALFAVVAVGFACGDRGANGESSTESGSADTGTDPTGTTGSEPDGGTGSSDTGTPTDTDESGTDATNSDSTDTGSGSDTDGTDTGTGTDTTTAVCGDEIFAPGELCYEPYASIEVVNEGWALAVADLDGNGHLDLASAETDDGEVHAYGGNGAGAFSNMSSGEPTSPYDVVVGEFGESMDETTSHLDMAFALNTPDEVAIVINDGTASLATTGDDTASVGQGPLAMISADLNGDDWDDIVVANDSSSFTVLLAESNGAGTFSADTTSLSSAPASGAPALIELNGAGGIDLVIAVPGSDWVMRYLGNGSGGFGDGKKHDVGDEPMDVVGGDLDEDGNGDVVTANLGDNDLSIALGLGNGSFDSSKSVSVGQGPRALAIADLNNDGHLDVVVCHQGEKTLTVLPGKGDATFGPGEDMPLDPEGEAAIECRDVELGDFNEDGALDMVVGLANTGFPAYLGLFLSNP